MGRGRSRSQFRGWSDDVADRRVGAVGGIEAVTSSDEVFEFGSQDSELTLPRLHVKKLGRKHGLHVGTRRGAFSTQIKDGGDLDEGEARCLSTADEPEKGECRGVVRAVAVGPAPRMGKQTLALVEADGLCRHAYGVGDFSDAHSPIVRLDLLPGFKVYGFGVDIKLLYFEDCPNWKACLLYTSPSPRDGLLSRMPSS